MKSRRCRLEINLDARTFLFSELALPCFVRAGYSLYPIALNTCRLATYSLTLTLSSCICYALFLLVWYKNISLERGEEFQRFALRIKLSVFYRGGRASPNLDILFRPKMPKLHIKKTSWTSQPHVTHSTSAEKTPTNLQDLGRQQALENETKDRDDKSNSKSVAGETNVLGVVSNPTVPLRLFNGRLEKCLRLPTFFYNALLIEIRDMFRMLDGMARLSEQSGLYVEHLTSFYEWFEGFFGMVTSLFDTEEDILFSWIEKIASGKMKNGLSPKRRKTKKQRVKELCFDIFDLKIQFSRSSERFICVNDFLKELSEEAGHLALRIISYVSLCRVQVTMIIHGGFNEDEKTLIDTSFLGNLKASGPGKFLLCAIARSIPHEADKAFFFEEAFKGKASAYERKFRKSHSDLVEKLAVDAVHTVYL